MKKKIKGMFASVNKVFLVGFTLLTIATFDWSPRWLLTTFAGYGLVAWQMKNYER